MRKVELDEITVNGKKYVDKAQLLELILEEKRRYRENSEPGYLHKKKGQAIAAELSLNHLAVLLCSRYYEQLHEKMFRYMVASINPETGTLVYLRKFCLHTPDNEGKAVPVFSEDPNDGVLYDERQDAAQVIREMRQEQWNMELWPVQFFWTLNREGLRRLHSFIGWPRDRDPEDVLLDELRFRKKPE